MSTYKVLLCLYEVFQNNKNSTETYQEFHHIAKLCTLLTSTENKWNSFPSWLPTSNHVEIFINNIFNKVVTYFHKHLQSVWVYFLLFYFGYFLANAVTIITLLLLTVVFLYFDSTYKIWLYSQQNVDITSFFYVH